jgi:acetyl esterase/lipase
MADFLGIHYRRQEPIYQGVQSMLSPRQVPLFTLLLLTAASSAQATDAAKLLPADTKAILTLNLRQTLIDHKNTEFVQRYLDQYRLALRGDDKELKKYYQVQEIDKSEGISQEVFLARCGVIKSVSDALGMDPLEDIDQITYGFHGEHFVVIVEGRFKTEKFKAAIEQIAREYFGTFNVAAVGNFWQIPDDPSGACVSLLDANTLAITDGKKTMDTVLQLAAGKAKAGLASGMRTLLAGVQKEHVGIVVDDVDRQLQELVRYFKEQVARHIDVKEAVGKFIVTQGADWIEKYGKEVSSASFGLSVREDDFRLQFAIDARKAASAMELSTLMQNGNFWGAIALKTFKNDVAQQLANILVRQRFVLRDTTLITQIEVPYDFVKLLTKGPWLNLLAKDLGGPPEPMAAKVSQSTMDVLSTRLTHIPLWNLPPRDKSNPPPAGTFEVEEVRDLSYRDGPADPIRQRLDMYLPKGKKDFPVLVFVHGGAWVIGDNRSAGLYSSVGQFLASQGIGVVLPNYRLSPGVKHPEHIKDVAGAFAWTYGHIGKYGGDVKRLYLGGHSAGGHLAALLATDETYLPAEGLRTSDIKGVIAISGVYKVPPGVMRFSFGGSGPRAMRLESMWPVRGDSDPSWKFQLPGMPAQLNMFAPVFGDTPQQCTDASPINHVRKGLPPFLILCADNDLPTLPKMADEFHEALKQAGCDVRLMKMTKRNHNSLIFSVISTNDPAARLILDFVK